jgi:hypothetical protein
VCVGGHWIGNLLSDGGVNMKILIQTQYMENYGDEKEPYWKYKGGEDYLFDCYIKMNEFLHKRGEMVVDMLRPYIESDGGYTKEYVIGWSFVHDDYQTDSERMQLKYDGEILYPAKRYDVDAFLQEQQTCA